MSEGWGGPRKGAGRPKLPPEQRLQKRSLGMAPWAWQQLGALADEWGWTQRDVLEWLIINAPQEEPGDDQ